MMPAIQIPTLQNTLYSFFPPKLTFFFFPFLKPATKTKYIYFRKPFSIRNVENPDLVIDLSGSFTTSGNKILIWPKNTPLSYNQIWKLAPV